PPGPAVACGAVHIHLTILHGRVRSIAITDESSRRAACKSATCRGARCEACRRRGIRAGEAGQRTAAAVSGLILIAAHSIRCCPCDGSRTAASEDAGRLRHRRRRADREAGDSHYQVQASTEHDTLHFNTAFPASVSTSEQRKAIRLSIG